MHLPQYFPADPISLYDFIARSPVYFSAAMKIYPITGRAIVDIHLDETAGRDVEYDKRWLSVKK
jgi:hypothetical protein